MKRIEIFVIVAGAMLATAAHATTMNTSTQAITFGPGLTDFSGDPQNLSLFDSNLGTLDSITIGGTYGFTSTLTIQNGAQGSSSGSARTESAAGFTSDTAAISSIIESLLDSVGSDSVGGTTINAAAFDLLGTKSSYSLASGASTNAASNASTVTIAPVTDNVAADLQAFEAANGGSFDVLFNTATGTTLQNSGGNTGATEATIATGTVNLYYTYTLPPTSAPVPEPASLSLLGAGLLGIGMLRRARR